MHMVDIFLTCKKKLEQLLCNFMMVLLKHATLQKLGTLSVKLVPGEDTRTDTRTSHALY